MKSKDQSMLASILALIVGFWIVLSPIWIAMPYGAQVSTVITGLVAIVASIIQMTIVSSVPSWFNGIAAVWLFISMFVFAVGIGAAWSFSLSALALIILAIWDGIEIEHTIGVGPNNRNNMSPTM